MNQDEILNARQVAEQNPELDATRRQLFGENYLQDIDQGTGIAQYYTGFDNIPTLNYTPPVVETPAVDTSTPVVDTGDGGGGGGITGISTGEDDGIDYSQNPLTQMITTPDGDTMTVREAMTADQIYSPMSGGVTGDPIEVEDLTTPSNIGDFAITAAGDLPDQTGTISGAPVVGDFDNPTTGTISDDRLNEVIGGQPMAAGPFDYLQNQGIGGVQVPGLDYSQADIDKERLGNYKPSFETQEQTNAINEIFNNIKDAGAAGVDELKDSLTALGGKVKEGFDNVIEIGGKSIDLGKSLASGILSLATGIPGAGFVLDMLPEGGRSDLSDALGEEYGMDDIGRLTSGPMAGYSVDSAFGDISQAARDRAATIEDTISRLGFTEERQAKIDELNAFADKADGIEGDINQDATPADIDAESYSGDASVAEDAEAGGRQGALDARDDLAGVTTGDAGVAEAEAAADRATSAPSNPYSGGDGGVQSNFEDQYSDDNFMAGDNSRADPGGTGNFSDSVTGNDTSPGATGGEGGGGNGGGKIVCTMMNDSYGFGSFRNKIWLKHSKDLAPEYQIGYHKIFLPLVKLSKTNKVVKKVLEHIAVHRTIDIRQESRGKTHLLGRVYRKILEPICYIVGKYAK